MAGLLPGSTMIFTFTFSPPIFSTKYLTGAMETVVCICAARAAEDMSIRQTALVRMVVVFFMFLLSVFEIDFHLVEAGSYYI